MVKGYDVCLFYRGLNPVSDEEVIAMYEGSHVPLEIMSDFYGKVSTPSCTYDRTARTKEQNKMYLLCAAELPRSHHEAVHGHFLPA